MTRKIVIIDYGMSNMFSMKNALDRLGFKATISAEPKVLANADGAVLPGVGSFPEAAHKLESLGLSDGIKIFIKSSKPFLGVCLGFQLLFDSSDEFKMTSGLGILPGTVTGLRNSLNVKRVPHVGWNKAEISNQIDNQIHIDPLKGIGSGEYFYFVHSFYARPADSKDIYTSTTYFDHRFCSSILKKNIFACQFHPEKSGEAGLQLLSNIFSC